MAGETPTYFKLKAELSELLLTTIDSRIEKEKSLFTTYVGMGIKLLAFTLSLLVAILAYTGWKTFGDIERWITDSLDQKISATLDKVGTEKYLTLNKISAISSVLTNYEALNSGDELRSRKCDTIDRDTSGIGLLSDSLMDVKIPIDTRKHILDEAIILGCHDLLQRAAVSARSLINYRNEDPSTNVGVASSLIKLYRSTNSSSFAHDVADILRNNQGSLPVARLSAEYLIFLNPDEGLVIYNLLSTYNDPVIQNVLPFFKAKINPDTQLSETELNQINNSVSQRPRWVGAESDYEQFSLPRLMYFMSITNSSSKLFDQLYKSISELIARNRVAFTVTQFDALGNKNKYGVIGVSTYFNSTEASYTISTGIYLRLLKNIAIRYIRQLESTQSVAVSPVEANYISTWLPSFPADEKELSRFGADNIIEIRARTAKLVGADGNTTEISTLSPPIGLSFKNDGTRTRVTVLRDVGHASAVVIDDLRSVSGLHFESGNFGMLLLIGGDYIALE